VKGYRPFIFTYWNWRRWIFGCAHYLKWFFAQFKNPCLSMAIVLTSLSAGTCDLGWALVYFDRSGIWYWFYQSRPHHSGTKGTHSSSDLSTAIFIVWISAYADWTAFRLDKPHWHWLLGCWDQTDSQWIHRFPLDLIKPPFDSHLWIFFGFRIDLAYLDTTGHSAFVRYFSHLYGPCLAH
jgi:hypothetical protein